MIKLFLENFVLLFIAIDPISLLPIFASFTQGLNRKDITTLCLRAGTTAFLILLTFWVFGRQILNLMGISIDSFKIAGGIFLLFIAYEMLFEKRQQRRKETAEKAMEDEALTSLATFPLAIPLIAGPGAIAIAMLLSEKSPQSIGFQLIGFSPVFIIILLTVFSIWVSGRITEKLPSSVLGVLQRVFALLLGALAIEFIVQGLRQTLI
ncbi:MAG: MarC family protein [Paracoccaceae bacterium]